MTGRRSFFAALGMLAARHAAAEPAETIRGLVRAEHAAIKAEETARATAAMRGAFQRLDMVKRLNAEENDLWATRVALASGQPPAEVLPLPSAMSIDFLMAPNADQPDTDTGLLSSLSVPIAMDSAFLRPSSDASASSAAMIDRCRNSSCLSICTSCSVLSSTESSMARRGTTMLDGAGRSGNGAARFLSPQNGIEPGLPPQLVDSDQSVAEEVAHVHAQNLEGSST